MEACEWNVLVRMIDDADASCDEYRMLMSVVFNAYVEEALHCERLRQAQEPLDFKNID